SDELPDEYFPGLVSEVYNPVKNRFEKRVARNEPLDTWVYAYAAAHHPEVRLHRYTRADWDVLEARLLLTVNNSDSRETAPAPAQPDVKSVSRGTQPARPRSRGMARDGWAL